MEIVLVAALTLVCIVLFVTEALRADVVALLAMAVVLVTGLCTYEEGLAGFSNAATVTVAAMFVLSAGLEHTGTLAPVSRWIAAQITARGTFFPLVILSAVIGLVSAFINNTAAVAVFLPAVMGAARQARVSPGKFLFALSFVSMAGGTITLLGTSTNLLVSSIAHQHGQEAFSLFEFAPLGLCLTVIAILYMALVGHRLTPERRPPAELLEEFEVAPRLKEQGDNGARTYSLLESVPGEALTLKVEHPPTGEEDRMRDSDLEDSRSVLVEAGVSSKAEGTTLKQSDIRSSYEAVPLAIRRRNRKTEHRRLEDLPLRSGDTILFRVERDRLNRLRLSRRFTILSEEEPEYNERRRWLAVAIVAAVVILAATNVFPIVVSASVGALVMVLAGCLDIEQAYRAVDWKVIFLLAGMLSLGEAVNSSGAAQLLADGLVSLVHDQGPRLALALLYILATLLTATMSNNATAALLTPVALSLAEAMQVGARPFLVAVAFASSACFASPIGYQTNVMIYGPGRFKFRDFIKVGAPLNLLFLLATVVLIPMIWGFEKG